MKTILIKILIISIILPVFVFASRIHGIFSSSAYSFVRADQENNESLHIRTYQSILLTGHDIGLNNSQLSITGIVYYDPASDFSNGNHYLTQIYTFNYQKRLLSNRLRLRVGRHTIYTSSVYGRMDGLSTDYIYKSFNLKVFAGGYIPSTGITGDMIDSHLIGSELRWIKDQTMQLSVGLSNKAHGREIYKSKYTYQDIEVPATIQRRLGIRGYYNRDRISLSLLARINPSGFDLKDFNTHIDYSHGRIDHLSFEFKFFEPRIPDNSIFSVFDTYSTKEYRLSTDYKISQNYTGSFQYRIVQFNDDISQVLNVGVRTKLVYVHYTYQNGYGGASNRISGQINYQINRNLFFGRATIGNYKLIEGQWDDIATYVLGSRIPVHKKIFVQTELQILRNKYYNKDIRLLLNLSYRI
ncbi:MAG: hypothetical protein HQ521_16755 [Bacteroidetes bacterium]|nr:hypothetical protein [Bacteroidota bacterium]